MQTRTIMTLMQQGGAVMWPLFVLLAIVLVIVVERGITFAQLYINQEFKSKEVLEKPLAALDFIATLAPVLGFLGTVAGMISAFRSVSEATTVQLQLVASGLYEALFTTAFGLIVSVVATVFTFLFDLVVDLLCVENNLQ
jgi:biopolymer transport protein ExbB